MYKKGESKNFLGLFVKKAKKEDLPKLSIRTDITDLKKKYEELAKYETKLEELRAPIYRKEADKIGLTPKEIIKFREKEAEIFKQMKGILGEAVELETAIGPQQRIPPSEYLQEFDPNDPFRSCEEITVRICKERVCVDQPVPLNIDEDGISPAIGSGGSFQKYGNNKFKAFDGVSGYSYHSGLGGLVYHRGTRESTGVIDIIASGQLVESAKVRTVGITYKYFPDPDGGYDVYHMNQSIACGETYITVPNSWGRAKKYWDLKITSIIPGGAVVREYESSDDILVEDTGKCEWGGEHGCLYGGCWIQNTLLGVQNPPDGQVTIVIPIYKNFPPGTIFLVESSLTYHVKACGENASAAVCYGLEILPFINIEACSLEYPEYVTIRVSDWL
jgi:hypothetical protein